MTHSANFQNRHKRFDPSSLSDIAALTRCGHAQRRHAIFGAVAQAWVALRRLAVSTYQHLTRRLRRAELERYDDRLLRDMGISRYDLIPPRRGVHETVATWFRRSRERKQLARFTERELHDIGISRPDADMEIQKPFWRP